MTLREFLEQSVQRVGEKVLMRHKRGGEWHEISYAEFLALVRNASEFLARICHVRHGTRVAILAGNSPEWCIAYYAIVSLGAIAVPIDAKLREQEITHILSDSGTSTIFADARFYATIRDIEDACPDLRHAVFFNVLRRDLAFSKPRRVKYHEFEKLMDATRTFSESKDAAYTRLPAPKDDDIASFIYTSGTTGRQKGAMLTHANFTSDFQAMYDSIDVFEDDNFLLLLPLNHAFAFTTSLVVPICAGCEISFVESLRTISENIRETRPTIVCGVPLLLEKIRDKVKSSIKANKVGHSLWNMGLRAPIRKRIHENLGGRIRLFISGGAPIDSQILSDFADFGLHPVEGYGLTECAPVVAVTPCNEGQRGKPGSCGKALEGIEIAILDANEEGVGMIAVKGPNVMKGYFNNPAATEEVFRDGWFLTGDLGRLDEEGFLFITGRKKSLIVNREGKNIYPEEVENQINRSPYIMECVVLGYREENESVGEHVGVIVAPDEEAIAAKEKQLKRKMTEDEVRDLLKSEVRAQAQQLADYKRPRKVQVRWEEFNKTATGKIKRYLYAMNEASL